MKVNEIIQSAQKRMNESVEHTRRELVNIRPVRS